MIRDYTDFMNMTAQELAAYACDHATGNALVLALAHQLETQAELADKIDALQRDLEAAEDRADQWREEAQAIQRQLDQVRT